MVINSEEIEKTEGRIQAEAFQWFVNTYPQLRGLLYHVPNGGKRDRREAATLKATGVVPGVPDLEFHFYQRTYFLECKTPTGRLSGDQEKIHTVLNQHGFQTWIFRSCDEFKQIIQGIIGGRSINYEHAMTQEQFVYRNNVFMYLYGIIPGDVHLLDELVEAENLEKFKSVVFEFMNDGFDKKEGFEILFTPDFTGFYKSVPGVTKVLIDGFSAINIPAKNEQ